MAPVIAIAYSFTKRSLGAYESHTQIAEVQDTNTAMLD